jgi:hypothetical protein
MGPRVPKGVEEIQDGTYKASQIKDRMYDTYFLWLLFPPVADGARE